MDAKKLWDNAGKASVLLNALANPHRLVILCLLAEAEKSAGELWRFSALSQSAFSQHLAILRKQGLVKTRKESQVIYYSLADNASIQILEVLYKLYCK